jgi:type IV secretory pathway VirD2 relaxase
MTDDDQFKIRPGRIRTTRMAKSKSFADQVLRAAQKAGHFTGKSAGGDKLGADRSTFGRGRISFARQRLFNPARRVIVKARIVRHAGRAFRSAPMSAHLAYLARDGVSRDGEEAAFFGKETDLVDDRDFSGRCHGDRHHFRFIISPEDAADMTDLRAFTRDLARQMEADLGTSLDWVAVDHWNTDNPHVHLLVRGVAADGADLVISRDYISRGLRSRAEELVGIELGPRPKHEIRPALAREVQAERWTKLDQQIRFAAKETGYIDLRPRSTLDQDGETRRLMIGRLQHLQSLGLAQATGPGAWVLDLGAERTLRDLAQRLDIIKTMHQAFVTRGEERGVVDFAFGETEAGTTVIGRLVGKGLQDELTGEAYAIIDGIDGRAHHIKLPGIKAFDQAPPLGGIVELRRLGGADAARPTLMLTTRSDFDLRTQVPADGATWLDYRLVERDPMPLSNGGFGGEVRRALVARVDHHVDQGLATRQGAQVTFQRNLLSTLRQNELTRVAASVSLEFKRSYIKSESGEQVEGIYRKRLSLASGRFAMIENGLVFQLVPWSTALEKRKGLNVLGVARASGGVDWKMGRKLDLGM